MTRDEDNVNISSSWHPDTGAAVCLLEWGPVRSVLEPDVVLNTARDLQAAASRAETDIALIRVLQDRLGGNIQATAAFLRDVRTERPMLPGKSALRIEAVAGAGTGMPYVHIGRGSMKGSMSPDVAREMALHWTETAVAAHNDARLRYVLGEYPHITTADIAGIFAGLRATGGDQVTERNT
jgi:hypothetical protein